MNPGDYEKQVQKATREPTQLFLMEKGGCLRRQSQEPRRRCQEQRRTMDGAPPGCILLTEEEDRATCAWQDSRALLTHARHVPSFRLLFEWKYLLPLSYLCPPLFVEHVQSIQLVSFTGFWVQRSHSQGTASPHLELTEITGSGPLNLML